ncbi:hypothetical protein BDQ17DRAFT_1243978 [Cyathus striatus]|nr:hypothetical protein BDQ17DRAFT_1243978 [Cyathus striatus]
MHQNSSASYQGSDQVDRHSLNSNIQATWPKRNHHKDRSSVLSETRNRDGAYRRAELARTQERSNNTAKREKVIEKRIDVYIPSVVSVGQLAKLLKVRLDRLQRTMKNSGMEEEAIYDHVLTSDYACLLAEEFGRNPIVNDEATFDLHPPPPHPDSASLPNRPPVVTIMGHVDHGKTTLLDTLRSSAVAKGEAGGITQHIGAFSVPVPVADSSSAPHTTSSSIITFLDTPGHAAFSAMRARGASVTDIIVLVVAADDGIMPQTREVIELAKNDNSGTGLVVAINKIDKPGVNVESVEHALLAEGIQLELLGGDVPCVHLSGLTGQGLPDLLETISTMAEIQDLRAEHEGRICGCVLESRVQKGLGSVATVLVRRGCLRPGSHILSGTSQAKVRLMTDSSGNVIKAAYPGTAVIVSGWKSLPKAGDDVLQGTESEVRKALANRIHQAGIEAALTDLEAINASRRQDREKREQEKIQTQMQTHITVDIPEDTSTGIKELRLIIKADVSGSAEAVEGALQGMGNHLAMTRIIHTGVGDVTESDVMLAKAAGATIVAFSVPVSRSVQTIATQNEVPICISPIIYKLMELVREKVIELLPTITKTKIIAEAKVLQLFDIKAKNKQILKVAGCRVTDGKIEKAKTARVVRDSNIIHEGKLDTLRYLRDDVTEVRKGSECGLSFAEPVELREGDIIRSIEIMGLPGEL